MRIFIGEYICGGGMRRKGLDSIDASLKGEGAAMLAALASDVSKFAELSIPIDARLCPLLPDAMLHEMDLQLPLWGQWVRAAQGCDAAILIVPETDGGLAKAVGMLRAGGIDVVASSGNFLRDAGDKHHTARVFSAGNVPHPVTYNALDPKSLDRLKGFQRFVLKPHDGCGAQQIFLFDDLESALAAATPRHVLQGFVPGKAVSIATIVSSSEMVTLPAVSQDIALDNCAYSGGCGPLSDDQQRRATALAEKALAAMPSGARGFIGFDLILGEDASHDVVIEVNARLTTSYVGIRHMVAGNLASRILGLECGPVRCKTPTDSVRWTATGEVWVYEQRVSPV